MKIRFKYFAFLFIISVLLLSCSKDNKSLEKGTSSKSSEQSKTTVTTLSETSTESSETTTRESETVTEKKTDEKLISNETLVLISDYYKSEYKYFNKVYDIGEEVEKADEDAVKLDSAFKLQEIVVGDKTYGIFKLMTSIFYNDSWAEEAHIFVINSLDNGSTWQEVIGELSKSYQKAENYTFTEEDILELKNNLYDINASLKLEGYSGLIGAFSSPDFLLDEAKTEIMEDYEPIYEYGDYWVTYHYPQMDVLAYYSNVLDKSSISWVESTREDVSTYDGIKIGSSRDDVLKTYSKFEKYKIINESENIVHYGESEFEFGMNLIFEFKEGKVSKITLYNEFN